MSGRSRWRLLTIAFFLLVIITPEGGLDCLRMQLGVVSEGSGLGSSQLCQCMSLSGLQRGSVRPVG